MAPRRLSAEEAALWQRVMASVRPLPDRLADRLADRPKFTEPPVAEKPAPPPPKPMPTGRPQPVAPAPAPKKPPRVVVGAETLDGSWDRRLSRGLVSPDRSIDLHGHGLNSAYVFLDQALEQAIRNGDRLILLVTGKPPPRESERPHARGAIRAAIGDWLAASRHGDRIAAVRGAHPRHGGTGALYIILRRPRGVS